MTNCEQYLEYQKQWSKAASSGDEQKYRDLVREAHKFRDENFTRDDWDELINQSSGRAMFEYKRMKNAKFPQTEVEDYVPKNTIENKEKLC